MRTLYKLLVTSAFVTLPLFGAACGGDDDSPGDTPGTGGSGATGGSATGGTAGTGTGGTGGGTGGTAGNATGGTGGMVTTCDISGAGKTKEAIPKEIMSDMTLTSDKVWTLSDITTVNDGATLTIDPCTRIEGTKTPIGVLVVARGGKIMANGTENEPILFTSQLPAGSRSKGNWGGVVVLGKAPNFDGEASIEGLDPNLPRAKYGGSDANDSSGSMSYVRIEYGGFELSDGKEINGLTLGSVGKGTTINHIAVTNTLDDCFEWFGGTVDADHLVCSGAGDDMFDVDSGYVGKIEYAFGRSVAPLSDDPSGFEMDSDKAGVKMPNTNITASKVTLCGVGSPGAKVGYGQVLRESLKGTFSDIVVTGFDFGVDTRDNFGTLSMPNITVENSIFFENFVGNVGDPSEMDDDMGFDEDAWFGAGAGNVTTTPGYTNADCLMSPPAASVTGSAKGAFKDGDWLTGAWIDWAAN